VIRLKSGDRLVVASHNPGKVKEIRELIGPFGIETLGAAELGLAEPEEIGTTFAENAALKADTAARSSGLPALSDDSGLCVPALDGAPGIYSARWAGPAKDFRLAMRRVEQELQEKATHDARAYFVCALALAAPGEQTQIFEGRVFGALTFPPRGDKGFGYDPVFVPEGHRVTFGEMDPKVKHAMSHRARAFAKFVARAVAPSPDQ
jgi:XTP/dITP diphosphohydrolase